MSLQDDFNSLLTKLDADAGVTDTDYNSTLAGTLGGTLDLPSDILLPIPETEKEAELYNSIKDYVIQVRQVLTEIESKLP